MSGSHNSAHSEQWRGAQGRYIRQYVKLRRRGSPPIDGKRLELILAQDRTRKEAAK
jgi:hypothetical protein